MSFPTRLEWNQPGVEPPQTKKDQGWLPEEKPPAEYFNWLFNRICLALSYLKENKVEVSDGQIDALALRIINLADGVEPTDAVNIKQFRERGATLGRNYVIQGIANGSGVQEAIRKQADTILEMPAGVLLNFAAGMNDYGPVDIVEKLEEAETLTPAPADASTIPLAYTEDLCVGGAPISGGDNASYPKANAFDNNPSGTYWLSSQTGTGVVNLAYIGYEFASAKVIRKITLVNSASNGVRTIEVQASNGAQWFSMAVVSITGGLNIITIPGIEAYKSWRLLAKSGVVDANGNAVSSGWTVWEIEMMEALETHYVAADRNLETKDISLVTTKNKPRVTGDSNVITIPGYYTADLCEGGTPISSGDSTSYPKANAFDKNATTYWQSSTNPVAGTTYLGYIFSSPKIIRKLVIAMGANTSSRIGSYKLQSGNNGGNWVDIATLNFDESQANGETFLVPPSTPANSWRLLANESSSGPWQVVALEMMGWVEPQIITTDDTKYTDNVCIGGVAISNGDYTGYPKENAFDGNNNTAWYSSQTSAGISGNASIGYDLGVARIIRKMQVIQGDIAGLHGIISVKVQNSSSGTTWNDVVTVTLESGLNNIDIPANAGARFWRILANANISGTGNAWFIHEITMHELATDLDYYDPINGKTLHFDGTTWTDKQRIYVGEIQVDSARKIVKVTNYSIGVGNLRVKDAERKDEPVALGQLIAELTTNGCAKVPVVFNGMRQIFILQWGDARTNNGVLELTLPIMFPNACLQGFVTDFSYNSSNIALFGVSAVTNKSMTVHCNNASGYDSFRYWAIGY